jgi:hypothetical protein
MDDDAKVAVDVNNVPPGMKVFQVVGTRIKDSTDSYRDDGELCLLDKALAKHYDSLEMIKVPIDFDGFDGGDATNAAGPKGGAGSETETASGKNNGKAKP